MIPSGVSGHSPPSHGKGLSRKGDAMNTGDPWPPFRVLCVDDNRDSADSAALLLRTMGFETRACYDGPSALLLNDSFRPGVCFLDLNMPGMDGDEVAVRIRQGSGWRPLLLIALTAMSNEAGCARITAAGFDMHLVKPVDPGKLVEVVDLLFRVAGTARAPAADNGNRSARD
jgi:two-component system, OmpR family, response regulator